MNKISNSVKTTYPLLPLRDVVIFPHMVIPLFVGRGESIKALEYAMEHDKEIFLSAQKDASIESPKQKELYEIGTVATILQMLRLPDGTVKVLVEGSQRAKLNHLENENDTLMAQVSILEPTEFKESPEMMALMRSLINQFEKLVKSNKKIPAEIIATLANVSDPGRLADTIAAQMTVKIESRQQVL